MYDVHLRALMATDEIPRADRGWRRHSNRPPRYAPLRSRTARSAPRRLW